MRPAPAIRRVFRPALWFRLPVVVASAAWSSLIVLALLHGLALPAHVWVTMCLFAGLFVVATAHYWSMRITVDDEAVTYRALNKFRSYPFDEILEVRVTPAMGFTSYDVRTRFDGLCFTSFIGGHRDLASLIVARANLLRRRRPPAA